MEAKLHLYVSGNVEAKLDVTPFIPPRFPHMGEGKGTVKPRLDRAPNVEPELCLRLAPPPGLPLAPASFSGAIERALQFL
jgi:hypothetical protein